MYVSNTMQYAKARENTSSKLNKTQLFCSVKSSQVNFKNSDIDS